MVSVSERTIVLCKTRVAIRSVGGKENAEGMRRRSREAGIGPILLGRAPGCGGVTFLLPKEESEEIRVVWADSVGMTSFSTLSCS